MAKLILSMDNLVLREITLSKERTTIGRKPSNDIQIDNLAVSGEHAVIVTILNDSFLEDLGSTNGTLVNGNMVKKHFLQNNDIIELGKYKLKFISEQPSQVAGGNYEKTVVIHPKPGLKTAEGLPQNLQPAEQLQPQPQSQSQTQTQTQTQPQLPPQPQLQPQPPDTIPNAAFAVKHAAETKPVERRQTANQLEPSVEAKSATESKAPTEVKLAAGTRLAAEAKPATEVKPAAGTSLANELRPATEMKPLVEARPAAEMKSATEIRPATEAKQVTESRPGAELRIKPSELKPAVDVKPVPEAKPAEAKPVEAKLKPSAPKPAVATAERKPSTPADVKSARLGAIQILTGPSAGKELDLTKSLTTLGKPGVQVAVITRRPQGYFITHVEGATFPLLNGKALDAQAHPLNDHDIIELGGIKMEFFLK